MVSRSSRHPCHFAVAPETLLGSTTALPSLNWLRSSVTGIYCHDGFLGTVVVLQVPPFELFQSVVTYSAVPSVRNV